MCSLYSYKTFLLLVEVGQVEIVEIFQNLGDSLHWRQFKVPVDKQTDKVSTEIIPHAAAA